mgnify:CR=1 FL=1
MRRLWPPPSSRAWSSWPFASWASAGACARACRLVSRCLRKAQISDRVRVLKDSKPKPAHCVCVCACVCAPLPHVRAAKFHVSFSGAQALTPCMLLPPTDYIFQVAAQAFPQVYPDGGRGGHRLLHLVRGRQGHGCHCGRALPHPAQPEPWHTLRARCVRTPGRPPTCEVPVHLAGKGQELYFQLALLLYTRTTRACRFIRRPFLTLPFFPPAAPLLLGSHFSGGWGKPGYDSKVSFNSCRMYQDGPPYSVVCPWLSVGGLIFTGERRVACTMSDVWMVLQAGVGTAGMHAVMQPAHACQPSRTRAPSLAACCGSDPINPIPHHAITHLLPADALPHRPT